MEIINKQKSILVISDDSEFEIVGKKCKYDSEYRFFWK